MPGLDFVTSTPMPTQVYRDSGLGLALVDALEELIDAGKISGELATKMLEKVPLELDKAACITSGLPDTSPSLDECSLTPPCARRCPAWWTTRSCCGAAWTPTATATACALLLGSQLGFCLISNPS